MRILILILCGAWCGTVALGQQSAGQPAAPALPKPALPAGPLLRRQGDYAKWEIDYYYTADKAKPAPGQKPKYPPDSPGSVVESPPRKITITRTRPLWRAETVDIKGHVVNVGGDENCVLAQPKEHGSPYIAPRDANGELPSSIVDFGRVDYPDMDWISADTYLGVQALGNGVPCLVFQKSSVDPATGAAGPVTVWISKKTRAPLLWQQGGVTRTFQQLPPPDGPLQFPPEMSTIFEGVKKDVARFKQAVPVGG